MTATTEPTAMIDERQFEHYLGRDTKTNVLFVGVPPDLVGQHADEQDVRLRVAAEGALDPALIEHRGRFGRGAHGFRLPVRLCGQLCP